MAFDAGSTILTIKSLMATLGAAASKASGVAAKAATIAERARIYSPAANLNISRTPLICTIQ